MVITDNEDQAVNLAQVLANRLKESRPLLDSIGHNGARIMEKMPDVISEVGDKIVDFKAKVAGVFNRVVGTFQRVMDSPDTPVTNGNLMSPHINPSMMPQMSLFQQQQLMQNPNFPQGQGQFQVPLGQGQFQMSPQGQGQFQTANDQRQVMLAQLQQARQREQQLRAQFMQQQQQQQMTQNQMPAGAMVVQGQSPQVNIQPNFQQPMGVPLQGQPFGQSPEANAQMAFVQNQMQPQIKVQDNNIQQTQGFQHSHQNPGQIMLDITMPQMPAVGPIQMQASSGLRQKRKAAFSGFRGKRQADPDCKRLKDDPDTYCRTFESQCHNCTLEKRLRFQVCGEGVERARDEIKRIDQSVTSYLETYETQIASEKLVLKIEFKGLSKLKKTTSYFDPFITAKIGPSIFRYKSKRILNINDLRATGSQIGDELWEKMWENGVFAEAKEVHIVPDKVSILGQAQVKEVHSSHAHAQTHGSGGNRVTTSLMTVVFGTMIFLL
ncbi:uncharacterized protein LOC127854659 [Dreissena polymorpha]|uniref:uncharacterized protein LOC127854659 n=1 Tax=Dreissena polymorpha TaxID=45954 RepID=UPI002264ABEA|nr:uncharacterized protein LOC127854659 [Dreissena polymorpha]